jgi:hypothetical protein
VLILNSNWIMISIYGGRRRNRARKRRMKCLGRGIWKGMAWSWGSIGGSGGMRLVGGNDGLDRYDERALGSPNSERMRGSISGV